MPNCGGHPVALLEDALKSRSLTFTGLGLLALALSLGFPSLRKQWVAVLTEGVKLYFEASGEAEVELTEQLAEFALSRLVQALTKPEEERKERVKHVITRYKKRARARSNRWGRTETGREARYQQHISHLRSKVARRHASASGEKQIAWEGVLRQIG